MPSEIKFFICVHKPCLLPENDIFLPVQAGKLINDIDLGIQGIILVIRIIVFVN
jgi:hypothetical protein